MSDYVFYKSFFLNDRFSFVAFVHAVINWKLIFGFLNHVATA